jgi:hypothetical protein
MDNERQGRFTWIYATGAFVLVLVTIFAVAFAVQEHNDRVLSEELSETASELQDTGARIANIRDAEMKNMDDYVRAFSEIGPLWIPTIDTWRGSRTFTTRRANEIKDF